MPPIYYLNPPPNPFWDFVAGMEDHPFFAGHRNQAPPPPMPPRPEQTPTTPAGPSEKAKGKQAEGVDAEDPPEVDPSTVRPEGNERGFPFRGRGRFAKAFENNDDNEERCRRRGGPGCRGRGFGPHHGPHHGHPHGPGPHGPPGPPPFGPPPFGTPGFMFGPPPFWAGHRGPHGPHGGMRGRCGRGRGGEHGRSPPRGGPGGFDLSRFLNVLGERLGVDLSSAAEGLGLDRWTSPRSNADADFEPRTDIFDTASRYIIHLSLPGAKKSDVGVDWDGEHSVLRVAGVVHRPNVDEELMTQLSVDGRKREVGVFEKNIRLGTKRDPASVDIAGITAKMVDGVLIVTVPKVEREFKKREVAVDGSSHNSPERPEDAYTNEKDLLFDAEEQDDEMYDAEPTLEKPKETPPAAEASNKEKEAEAEKERTREARSETMDFEQPANTTETLPKYQVEERHGDNDDGEESDWEKAGSEDEGEYVKINVD